MEPEDLVDAALAGFDAGETVTIPSLADESARKALQAARIAMASSLSRRDVAPRYLVPAASLRAGDVSLAAAGSATP